MTPLEKTISDDELLAYIDHWVVQLEQENYGAALEMVECDPSWTPDLLREVIKSYGEASPTQRATLEAKATDIQQRKEIDRWDEAPNGSLGEVWYDLGIDGFTSDLTATFDILGQDDGLILHLNGVQVM